jgi:branched-chain amino acid transport system substrate-binding protein
MNTRLLMAVVAASLLTVVLAGCSSQAQPGSSQGAAPQSPGGASAQPKGEVVLGVTAPLTGTYAEYGQIWKKAMDIAVAEINEKEVIPGKTLRLQFEDSQSDPKQAATIAKKLADDSKIAAVIGDFSSSASLAAAPIYLAANKVQVSPTASDPKFSLSGEYMFSIVGSQKGEAPFLAKLAAQDLGAKRIAVMYINNDWGQVTKDIFVDAAKKEGATIVEEQAFLDQDKDFRATLTRLQAQSPDLLFVAGFYAQVSLMQKQRVDLGWSVPVLTPSSSYSPELVKQGGSAVEGQMLASVFFPGDPNPRVQTFAEVFKGATGEEPNQFAALAYDAVYLLSSTIAKTGTESAKIRDGLASFASEYEGVTGPMKFDEDRIVVKSYVPLVVKDKQFEVWKK